MFRYLAILCDSSSTTQCDAAAALARRICTAAAQWSEVLRQPGLQVFCAGADRGTLKAIVLPKKAGVILGNVFHKNAELDDDTPCKDATFDERTTNRLRQSRGLQLATDYWGNFVAIGLDETGSRKWILKDPTGSLPCFISTANGMVVVFSCAADCKDLRLQFSVNWLYVQKRATIAAGSLEERSLNEVIQVRGGETYVFDPKRSPALSTCGFAWNPLHFADNFSLSIEGPAQAARVLRAAVRTTTQTLARGHENILQRLSGGLDSSIVLGCLAQAPWKPRVAAYTYYNPNGRLDPRPWARVASDHAAVNLIERIFDPSHLRLELLLAALPTIEPQWSISHMQTGPTERQLAAEHGFSAVFTGDGGDSTFGGDSVAYALDDYLRRHGPHLVVLPLAARIALKTELSAWQVLFRALQRWLTGSRRADTEENLSKGAQFVTADTRNAAAFAPQCPHPWFRNARRLPLGTFRQLGHLTSPLAFYDLSCDHQHVVAPECISPLQAQPVIEAALRIPIYVHFERGRDRGLARRAFCQEAPEQILRREWKDGAPGFLDEVFQRNWSFVRELLMDGLLVKERILDKRALDRVVAREFTKAEYYLGELLRHVDVEVWLRQWTESQALRAVA